MDRTESTMRLVESLSYDHRCVDREKEQLMANMAVSLAVIADSLVRMGEDLQDVIEEQEQYVYYDDEMLKNKRI